MVKMIQKLCLYVVILSTLLLAGCTAMELRDAQDHFSRAAEFESQENLQSMMAYRIDSTAIAYTSALTEYRLAYALVDKIIRDQGQDLQNDGLLGTAYMLKAYSLWRINALMEQDQQTPKATTLASGSGGVEVDRNETTGLDNIDQYLAFLERNSAGLGLGKRDEVMLKALPGLVDHERGRASSSWDVAQSYFNSAYCSIGLAAQDAPPDHPVRAYLFMSMVQTVGAEVKKLYDLKPENEAEAAWLDLRKNLTYPLCGLDALLHAPTEENTITRTMLTNQLRSIGVSYRVFVENCPVDLPASCN